MQDILTKDNGMDNCVKRIMELEKQFSDNDYNGSGSSAFVLEKGSIPIMISAPHAVNHFRNGEIKYADVYTGGIARYLNEMTGCHLIYASHYAQCDPNYDEAENNEYQRQLKEYVSQNEIALLLDLHGAARNREYAVELGTAPEKGRVYGMEYDEDPSLHEHKYVDDIIRYIFEKRFVNMDVKQKKVWKNVIFSGGTNNTITKYISQNTSTPCIQLEINRNYRDPENEKELSCLSQSLIYIINFFSDIRKSNDVSNDK